MIHFCRMPRPPPPAGTIYRHGRAEKHIYTVEIGLRDTYFTFYEQHRTNESCTNAKDVATRVQTVFHRKKTPKQLQLIPQTQETKYNMFILFIPKISESALKKI